MMKCKFSRISITLVLVAALSAVSLADFSFTGTLPASNPADGTLVSGGKWLAASSLTWTVTFEEALQRYHYEYSLTVPNDPAISHLIIEVSDDDPGPAFTSASLLGIAPGSVPDGWIAALEIGWDLSTQASNPGLLEDIYGIKFEATDDQSLETTVLTVDFYSNRVPVWGDFYAKGGNDSYVYNSGLATADPLAPAANGALNGHLLVPDSQVVPLPGALLLGSLGLGFAGWLRKKQNA